MWRRPLDDSATIFALASGPLPSAVAIVRLSGLTAFSIARSLFIPAGSFEWGTRGMALGRLSDHEGAFLDDSLMLSFVGPSSFSGEDVVEFQCHGTRAIIQRLCEALEAKGARQAVAGEFAFRAFSRDKLSLSEAARLAEVYQAADFADLSRVYGRRDEALDGFLGRLKDQLLSLQGVFDTAVDFSEEYSAATHHSGPLLESIIRECSAVIHRYSRLKEAPAAPRVVLVGRPNAGKSSLFNALLGRYRTLVAPLPGTTRDVVEEEIELGGRRIRLVDTAGFRDRAESVEVDGMKMGEAYLAGASYWLLVVDGTEGWGKDESKLISQWGHKPHRILWNKKDSGRWKAPDDGALPTSALAATGISEVWKSIEDALVGLGAEAAGPLPTLPLVLRLESLVAGAGVLQREIEVGVPPEILGERARALIGMAEGLLGPVDPDQVLDKVFSQFCVGK